MERIKLTFGANLSSIIAGSSCGYLFQEDVSHAKGCVVLGYAAPRYDIDIVRIFANTAKRSSVFFFSGTLSGRSKRNVELVGIDTGERIEDFASHVENEKANWTPDTQFHPLSLVRFQPQLRTSEETSIDAAFRFFALGDCGGVNFLSSKSFILKRSQCDICCTLLEEKKVLILHSFFGNGKTVLSNQISATLSSRSWQVYYLESDLSGFHNDIDRLASASDKDKILVIIEEFSKYGEHVEYALRRASDNFKLLLTDRTSSKEAVRLDLDTADLEIGLDVAQICCDSIERKEAPRLIDIFDRFGLWQKKLEPKKFVPFQSPEAAKLTILMDDCHGQFQNILLYIMESEQMRKRLEGLFVPLYQDPELKKVLITLCILIISKISLSSILLNSICGNIIFQRKFVAENKIHQLIDFSGNCVRFRSAITAEYVIKNICDFEYFFEIMENLFWKLDELNGLRQNFHEDLSRIMVFSSIERITPDKFTPESGKSENEIYRINAIIKYLENIKDTNYCSSYKSDFYLQLAIAFLAKDDLAQGEAYLNHAQNFAHSSRMKYKVSNQVSRLLLAKAARASSLEEGWPHFVSGREIIEDQMQTALENEVELEYPFARASSYYEFVKRFGNSFSRSQLDEVLEAVAFVGRRIDELPEYLKKRARVKNCVRKMSEIKKFFRLA